MGIVYQELWGSQMPNPPIGMKVNHDSKATQDVRDDVPTIQGAGRGRLPFLTMGLGNVKMQTSELALSLRD